MRHRYVHGGFAGTETRFSFYLPPAEQYEGRFFQHITPVPDSEHLAQAAIGEEDKIGFSIASGAYFLETNGGGTSGTPGVRRRPDHRRLPGERRGRAVLPRGRGGRCTASTGPTATPTAGSGGGYRTIGGAENTTGVWDGVVPYVIGSPMAIPNMFTVRMHAQRVLRRPLRPDRRRHRARRQRRPVRRDSTPRSATRSLEVTRMGFPPRSWFGHRTMGMHAFPVLFQGLRHGRPDLLRGLLDRSPATSAHDAAAVARSGTSCSTAARSRPRSPIGEAAELDLAVGPQPGQAPGRRRHRLARAAACRRHRRRGPADERAGPVEVRGGELIVTSGAAAGARLAPARVVDDIAVFGPGDPDVMAQLRPGDAVEVDNRGFLAAQTYHRHQVPDPRLHVWDQFRDPDGTPIYPQRPLMLGPLFAAAAAGHGPDRPRSTGR